MLVSKHFTVWSTPVVFGACDKYNYILFELGKAELESGHPFAKLDDQKLVGYSLVSEPPETFCDWGT